MAGKLPGRALDSNTSLAVNTLSLGANLTINTTSLVFGNSTVNTFINSESITAALTVNVGSNVFLNTSAVHLGNSTVNTVIHTTGFSGNGALIHGINANNIATGTLSGSRLPATITNVEPLHVGLTSNGHVWYVYV